MADIVVNGNTSGAVTLSAPAVAGTVTVTLPATSGTMAVLPTATGVLAESAGGTGTTTGYYGFKNRIINGAMGIWQRGTSISVGSTSYTYTTDRFKTFSTNSATTVSQNTSVPTGFQYSSKLQRPNANTGTGSLSLVQIIETANCFDLAGQSVSFSFWAKAGANFSAASSLINVQILTGTTADQGGDPYAFTGLSAPLNTTQAITTTWTRYTFTATIASNVLEMATVVAFTPTGTAGADDAIYITGVQLEKGSTATSFDYRPYGTELALCQRYCPVFIANPGGGYQPFGVGQCASATAALITLVFPVSVRTPPTGITISAGSDFSCWQPSTASTAATGMSFNTATYLAGVVQPTGMSGLTQGFATTLLSNNTASSKIIFNGCEL